MEWRWRFQVLFEQFKRNREQKDMGVFKGLVLKFIHKDFHEVVRRMSAIDTFLFLVMIFTL